MFRKTAKLISVIMLVSLVMSLLSGAFAAGLDFGGLKGLSDKLGSIGSNVPELESFVGEITKNVPKMDNVSGIGGVVDAIKDKISGSDIPGAGGVVDAIKDKLSGGGDDTTNPLESLKSLLKSNVPDGDYLAVLGKLGTLTESGKLSKLNQLLNSGDIQKAVDAFLGKDADDAGDTGDTSLKDRLGEIIGEIGDTDLGSQIPDIIKNPEFSGIFESIINIGDTSEVEDVLEEIGRGLEALKNPEEIGNYIAPLLDEIDLGSFNFDLIGEKFDLKDIVDTLAGLRGGVDSAAPSTFKAAAPMALESSEEPAVGDGNLDSILDWMGDDLGDVIGNISVLFPDDSLDIDFGELSDLFMGGNNEGGIIGAIGGLLPNDDSSFDFGEVFGDIGDSGMLESLSGLFGNDEPSTGDTILDIAKFLGMRDIVGDYLRNRMDNEEETEPEASSVRAMALENSEESVIDDGNLDSILDWMGDDLGDVIGNISVLFPDDSLDVDFGELSDLFMGGNNEGGIIGAIGGLLPNDDSSFDFGEVLGDIGDSGMLESLSGLFGNDQPSTGDTILDIAKFLGMKNIVGDYLRNRTNEEQETNGSAQQMGATTPIEDDAVALADGDKVGKASSTIGVADLISVTYEHPKTGLGVSCTLNVEVYVDGEYAGNGVCNDVKVCANPLVVTVFDTGKYALDTVNPLRGIECTMAAGVFTYNGYFNDMSSGNYDCTLEVYLISSDSLSGESFRMNITRIAPSLALPSDVCNRVDVSWEDGGFSITQEGLKNGFLDFYSIPKGVPITIKAYMETGYTVGFWRCANSYTQTIQMNGSTAIECATNPFTLQVTERDGTSLQLFLHATYGDGGDLADGQYSIVSVPGLHGSITPCGIVKANEGDTKTFTIAPDTGYHIDDVLVDGESVGAVTEYIFRNISSDHLIYAKFAKGYAPDGNLMVVYDGNGATGGIVPVDTAKYAEGATVTVKGNTGNLVKTGVCFVGFSKVQNSTILTQAEEDAAGIISSFKIYSNTTLYATWARDANGDGIPDYWNHTIHAVAGVGGTINPSGHISVAHGGSLALDITADPGYRLESLLVDGCPVSLVSMYTFSNVTADHYIVASFTTAGAIIPENPTPGAGNTIIDDGDTPLADLPTTGDNNNILVLVGLMVAALFGIAYIEFGRKKVKN